MPQLKACQIDELQHGVVRHVMLASRPVAVVRCDDKVYALIDRCPHQAAPLSDGMVSTTRHELICPWHRFRFHLDSGESVTNPELKVRTLPVNVENGEVFVTI
jgi:nitrite reductase/ring-hydroxylating ferredoxin subunit